jgi:D-alanyl-D-alanine carboxypeptidase/D-alanyl-D-alanine-endopeptidase (penicillin-binding protein 4)
MKKYFLLILALPLALLAMSEEQKLQLHAGIEQILKESSSKSHVGIEIVSAETGESLYHKNRDQLFLPASNTKMFTGAAILHLLGDDYRFETPLLRDEAGNLYLKIVGDSELKVETLLSEIDGTIEGDFFIDTSLFDQEMLGPGWTWDDEALKWAATIDSVKQGLEKRGVSVKGEVKLGAAPQEATTVAFHLSPPLIEIVSRMMKESDNHIADWLFKVLGQKASGATGNWETGKVALKSFMEKELKIAPDAHLLADGSGLSRYNLIAPSHLTALLLWAANNPTFAQTLPISGFDGTLEKRMKGIEKRVRAKTGSLTGVTSLSGYISTESGERLAFAILINGFTSKAREKKLAIEDKICTHLAQL